MSLSAGHVTDVLTRRAEALRVLGNGVVPHAAVLAVRLLLAEPVTPAHTPTRPVRRLGRVMTRTAPGWLDWREHHIGPARPCRICHRPAICRDEHGRPCHKVCAETQPTATAKGGPDALVVDLDAYRSTRTHRRTA